MTAGTGPVSRPAFRALLRRFREARRWSQEKLAEAADVDHSLVSRWEGGSRGVTAEAVQKLAAGLRLSPGDRDRLLMAAGYMPERPEATVLDEPQVARLYRFLKDDAIPAVARNAVRELVAAAVARTNDVWHPSELAAD